MYYRDDPYTDLFRGFDERPPREFRSNLTELSVETCLDRDDVVFTSSSGHRFSSTVAMSSSVLILYASRSSSTNISVENSCELYRFMTLALHHLYRMETVQEPFPFGSTLDEIGFVPEAKRWSFAPAAVRAIATGPRNPPHLTASVATAL